MLIKKFAILTIVLALTACQAPGQVSGQIWGATTSKDQFTDKVTKMATVGDGVSTNFIVTHSLKYYPFVGIQDGELYVGVRSGGRYRIPTGTIQIRIDENASWTIGPEETPVYLAPLLPSIPIYAAIDSKGVIEKSQEKAMENMTKIMSPYTATTGDKAKSIIKEMLLGKVIKYRTVGINQAAPTTGQAVIDGSFLKSLREIGINPENL